MAPLTLEQEKKGLHALLEQKNTELNLIQAKIISEKERSANADKMLNDVKRKTKDVENIAAMFILVSIMILFVYILYCFIYFVVANSVYIFLVSPMVCFGLLVGYAKMNPVVVNSEPSISLVELICTSYSLFFRSIAMCFKETGMWIKLEILDKRIDNEKINLGTVRDVFNVWVDANKILAERKQYKTDSIQLVNDTVLFISYHT